MENGEIYRKAKADIYRKIGKICASAWTAILILIWAVSLIKFLFSGHFYPGFFLRFLFGVPAGNLIYNPLLLIGIIFFWRADVNEKPGQKSKWLKFLLAYIGFYILISMLMSCFVVFHRSTRRSMSMIYDETEATIQAVEPARYHGQGINTLQMGSSEKQTIAGSVELKEEISKIVDEVEKRKSE